ncbi:MAG: ATP-binding protein [Acidimicrobiales bacterium]
MGSTGSLDPAGASGAYLLGRLALVEHRVRVAVARRRAGDHSPDDPFRGLYLSEEWVDQLLAAGRSGPMAGNGGAGDGGTGDGGAGDPGSGTEQGARTGADPEADQLAGMVEAAAERSTRAGAEPALSAMGRRLGLDALDTELLLVALAPDLDARFEQLYVYLNDDVTRRRASVGLALALCGVAPSSVRARTALGPGARLVRSGLVVVDEMERPFLTRSLRVPDRVAAHCLGHDRPDPSVASLLHSPAPAAVGDPGPLQRAIDLGTRLVYVHERPGSAGVALALSALAGCGLPAVCADLGRLGTAEELTGVALALGREAALLGGVLVAGPIEAVVRHSDPGLRALAELEVPVVLHGRASWDPAWSHQVPLVVEAPRPTSEELAGMWRAGLVTGPSGVGADPVAATAQFRLDPDQVGRAAEVARRQAALSGEPVAASHLLDGARAQNAAGLERLARRIQPGVGWDDLVLAPGVEAHLREVAARARRRSQVLDEWGMRPGGGRGRGVAALFAGESGTGKTMSAEVLAGDLGLDLYAVNLATVVDKYVGETEKNLERIFTEADGVNAVLLFDEADALFGKRSEVRDANDRYANIEVAYLLQRMETFDGLAVLSTNLAANVDEAFARRLDALIEFPMPDVDQRLALWERCLTPGVPRAEDLDLAFCAKAFELSGGNIRSIALGAAYLASDGERAVTMGDLIRSVQREYRKLGRLCVASEFGPYFSLLS